MIYVIRGFLGYTQEKKKKANLKEK